MLALKYLLLISGGGLLLAAASLLLYHVNRAARQWRAQEPGAALPPLLPSVSKRAALKLAAAGLVGLLAGMAIVVVPGGKAAVRVSQISLTRPTTLYPGVHWVIPLVQEVAVYDIRDQMFTTVAAPDPKQKAEVLKVQTREGLQVGLGVAVRYRLDPQRLSYIHSNLPQPVQTELVPPAVAAVFRQVVPNYLVREVYAGRREELRKLVSESIEKKLGPDGILVKEVMVRDIQLPPEYVKGLEGVLLKEQENERLAFEVEIKQKMVRTAELEAEAQKVRQVKEAEGESQVTILQAKAEADAMQYTLPLKEKQIQQTRLEAEARKEAVVKNAEAAAVAKVTDSKAELERRKLFAEAEAHRIRLTAAADAERLKLEASVLSQNPLLIQKIIAERLSDKVQIMMVPTDGKFFFANDVLRAVPQATRPDPSEDPPPAPTSARRSAQ